MNFFDQILKKYAPTYIAATDLVEAKQQAEGSQANPYFDQRSHLPQGDFVQSNPDQGSYGADQPEAAVSDPNPYQQFGAASHTSAHPQPAAPIQHDDGPNPYAQWAPQAAPQHDAPVAAQASPQAPQEPVKQFSSDMVAQGPNTSTMPVADAHKLEQLRADVAMILNNGGSKADIAARLAKDGLDLSSVPDLDKELTYRDAHAGTVLPVGLAAATPDAPKPVPHGADQGQLDSAFRGAYDGITLGAGDELDGALSAGRGAIENALGYGDGKSMSQTYTETRDKDRQLLADDEHYNPWTTFGGQVVGNLALAPLAPEAGAARGALAVGGRAAAEGAVMGGAYGFNSSNGDLSDRAWSGAGGALGGAVAGGTLGAIGGRIAGNRAVPSEGREILNAADRLNVGVDRADQLRPLVGHTSDGGIGSLLTATAEPLIVSGKATGLSGKLARFQENAGTAQQRIAGDLAGGTAANLDTVGARHANANIPGTLASYDAESKVASDAMYTHASDLAGDAHLQTPATVSAIDAKLREWRGVPGGVAGSDALVNLRDQLAGNQWTVDGLRRLRTSFGDNIDSGNRTVREAANQLWPSLSRDIDTGLRARGNVEAARAYRAADRNYTTRSTNLDAINQILGDGKHSADTVGDNIARMSRTDYGQLSRAIAVLPADQQNSIRAAIVENLGRANPGKQNAAGDAFSFETFLTQWNRKNFSDEAKQSMLPAQTVRDFNDLARLASASRTLRGYGNASRSGVTVENVKQITKGAELLGAGIAYGAHALFTPAAIGTAAAAWGGGKLLATPGVARALVRASESRSLEVLSRRLSEVARRNPAMAQNIAGFQDAIVSGKTPDMTINQNAPDPTQDVPASAPANLPPVDDSGPNPYAQFAGSQ